MTAPGGPPGTIHYIYDLDGHLIAEADYGSGQTLREYIWLGDLPIALVANVSTTPVLLMVHADHLKRPIRMTDPSKATVWQAMWKPFGEPWSLSGTQSLDARFPGQWFQIETALAYNWHRHYDATTGRYIQPDPLSFSDGPSRYVYALNSPLMHIDPTGHLTIPSLINTPLADQDSSRTCEAVQVALNLKQCAFLLQCLLALDPNGNWKPKLPPTPPPPIVRPIKPDEEQQ